MDQTLLFSLGIMLVGLIGCVVPVLPGPPLVWLGALFYAWQTDFRPIGPGFLAILLILALIGATADLWMSVWGAKKGGASGWSQLAALVGGLIGLFTLGVPGLLIGAVGAIVLVEWNRLRDWNAVLRAGGGYLAGYLLSMVVEVAISLAMITLFLARLWLGGALTR
ncbi:MAG TPA: DUF456 domain-containing protein [Abditibacterium sp.]|jgi:hypothetical protein